MSNFRNRIARLAERMKFIRPRLRRFVAWPPGQTPPELPPDASAFERLVYEQLKEMDRLTCPPPPDKGSGAQP